MQYRRVPDDDRDILLRLDLVRRRRSRIPARPHNAKIPAGTRKRSEGFAVRADGHGRKGHSRDERGARERKRETASLGLCVGGARRRVKYV